MAGEPTLRALRCGDIPDAMRLKDAAGWNQTERDWAAVLRLGADGCFAIECDGAVQATAVAMRYGDDLARIGMVLTAPEYRRSGFARRLMEHAVEYLREKGARCIQLDATDMGRPLYAQLGFLDECAIERWRLPAAPALPPPAVASGHVGFAALDRQAVGADRTAVLEHLAGFDCASIPGCGYAMGRPGSTAAYFGPCVSRSAEAARALLIWFLSRRPGESVYWDLLPGNREALSLAREFGFERWRSLTRMELKTPGAPDFAHDNSLVFAIAGFEFG